MAPSNRDTGRTPMAMPKFGFGTWQNDDPEQCAESVRTALEVGYRHVDTAQVYGNEAAVGDGIRRASVDRDDVFLATKVQRGNYGFDEVLESTAESIERLGVDYIDLLYVHWPVHGYDPEDTLRAFQQLQADGDIDRIGVSNFEPEHLEEAVEVLDDGPFANQIEMHPLLPQKRLREVCRENGIEVVAYSPLARGYVRDVPQLQSVAEKHDASPFQVSLAWLREKDATVIPKATSGEHIRDNFESQSVALDDEDVATIDAIQREQRYNDPDYAPW